MSLTWTERQPKGNVDGNWFVAAGSADGSHLLVGETNGGRLYSSSDSGATWTERMPAGDLDMNWGSVAASSNGLVLLASGYDDAQTALGMWRSTDGGVNWSKVSDPPLSGNEDFYEGTFINAIACSADGSVLVGACGSGRVHVSTDGGASWTLHFPPSPDPTFGWPQWVSVATNDNGSRLMAGAVMGRLYLSTNSGNAWSEMRPNENTTDNWEAVFVGDSILIATGRSQLYVSTDNGNSWTGRLSVQTFHVSANPSGKRIFAVSDAHLYLSDDGGTHWESIHPLGLDTANWRALFVNGAGTTLLAGVISGRLYSTNIPLPPVPYSFPWPGRINLTHKI